MARKRRNNPWKAFRPIASSRRCEDTPPRRVFACLLLVALGASAGAALGCASIFLQAALRGYSGPVVSGEGLGTFGQRAALGAVIGAVGTVAAMFRAH